MDSITVDVHLPGDLWVKCLDAARDAYWLARRRGLSENDALRKAMDAAFEAQEPQ